MPIKCTLGKHRDSAILFFGYCPISGHLEGIRADPRGAKIGKFCARILPGPSPARGAVQRRWAVKKNCRHCRAGSSPRIFVWRRKSSGSPRPGSSRRVLPRFRIDPGRPLWPIQRGGKHPILRCRAVSRPPRCGFENGVTLWPNQLINAQPGHFFCSARRASSGRRNAGAPSSRGFRPPRGAKLLRICGRQALCAGPRSRVSRRAAGETDTSQARSGWLSAHPE